MFTAYQIEKDLGVFQEKKNIKWTWMLYLFERSGEIIVTLQSKVKKKKKLMFIREQ